MRTLEDGQSPSDRFLNEQYDFVNGITLAPGQSKMMLCKVTRIPKDTVVFKIGYTSSEKYYEESIELSVKNYSHIPVPRPETNIHPGFERQVQTLREMVDRMV